MDRNPLHKVMGAEPEPAKDAEETSTALTIWDTEKLEYLKALINYINSRKSYTLFMITFNLALISLIVTGVYPVESENPEWMIGVLVCLLFSAVFFVRHYHKLNKAEGKVVECFLNLNVEEAQDTQYNYLIAWVPAVGGILLILGLAGMVLDYSGWGSAIVNFIMKNNLP